MSDHMKFVLIKMGLICLAAFIYGFITARRKRRNPEQRPSEED